MPSKRTGRAVAAELGAKLAVSAPAGPDCTVAAGAGSAVATADCSAGVESIPTGPETAIQPTHATKAASALAAAYGANVGICGKWKVGTLGSRKLGTQFHRLVATVWISTSRAKRSRKADSAAARRSAGSSKARRACNSHSISASWTWSPAARSWHETHALRCSSRSPPSWFSTDSSRSSVSRCTDINCASAARRVRIESIGVDWAALAATCERSKAVAWTYVSWTSTKRALQSTQSRTCLQRPGSSNSRSA